jgi:hypothetical protein
MARKPKWQIKRNAHSKLAREQVELLRMLLEGGKPMAVTHWDDAVIQSLINLGLAKRESFYVVLAAVPAPLPGTTEIWHVDIVPEVL